MASHIFLEFYNIYGNPHLDNGNRMRWKPLKLLFNNCWRGINSDCISYEIDTAVEYKKYIIGAEPWAQERIPDKVKSNSNTMVGWNKNSVINAIMNL